jgi:hypothetical protein
VAVPVAVGVELGVPDAVGLGELVAMTVVGRAVEVLVLVPVAVAGGSVALDVGVPVSDGVMVGVSVGGWVAVAVAGMRVAVAGSAVALARGATISLMAGVAALPCKVGEAVSATAMIVAGGGGDAAAHKLRATVAKTTMTGRITHHPRPGSAPDVLTFAPGVARLAGAAGLAAAR